MAINLHVVRKCALTLRPEALSCEDSDWWSDAFIVEDAVVLLADSGEARGRQTISAAELNEVGVGDELDQLIRTKWAAAMDGDIRPADRVSVPKEAATVTRASILMKIECLQVARARYLIDGPTARTDTFLTNIREELDELDNLLQALDDQQRREEMSAQLFNNPDGRGGTEVQGVTYAQLYKIVRDKLEYFHPDKSDPDAFCQDMCCRLEKAQGIYPNVPGLLKETT